VNADALDAARFVNHGLEAAKQSFDDTQHSDQRRGAEHDAEEREERAQLVREHFAPAARHAHEEKSHGRA
jgi:hypothetical protein